jgi:putative FmdB family regulatory protein
MPIYEYECGKCGVFEHSQRITERALVKCPTCRRKVRRLISNTSFQLKGSGWYVTDYARTGAKKGANGEARTETSGDGKAESKSESKTTAAESKTSSGTTSPTTGTS